MIPHPLSALAPLKAAPPARETDGEAFDRQAHMSEEENEYWAEKVAAREVSGETSELQSLSRRELIDLYLVEAEKSAHNLSRVIALENNFSRHTGGDPLDTPDLEADPPQTGLERAAERLEEIGSEIKLQASKLHEATNFDDANDAKHYLEKALADLDAWLTAFNKPAAKLDPGTPDPRD